MQSANGRGSRPGRDALHARDGGYDEEADDDRVGNFLADDQEDHRRIGALERKPPMRNLVGGFSVK